MLSIENIRTFIDSGEGGRIEFKVRVPAKVRELTEEICAFANTDGGYLLIGVDDRGKVIGFDLENDKRSAIQGSIREISPVIQCEMYPVSVDDKRIWVIEVPAGKDKPYIIDDKTFGGSLYRQYLQAMAWLESKLQVAYKIEGAGPREEIWEIPLTVFKESIINALSHRDYYEQGASIMIEMFDDRVEISNPGGLLPVVAKDFGHKSMTRNPLIFGLFTRMHLVERVASGIPRMQAAMQEANLPEPEFHTEGMFTVVFKRGNGSRHETKTVLSLSQACPKLEMRYIPIAERIIAYCAEPHSIQEIMQVAGQTNRSRFKKNVMNPLLEAGMLFMTIPDKPNSPLQQYSTGQ